MKSKLNQVKDNNEKALSYKKQMERYKLAMKYEFYLEAMNIVYAMCEDRLNSFLYHSGCVLDRNLKISDKDIMYKIWNVKKCNLYMISTKIECIRQTLKWANSSLGYENDLEKHIKESIVGVIDYDAEIEYLFQLESWIKKRNPIIHGLLNKSIDGLNLYIKECAEEGLEIVRNLDKENQKFKLNK